MACLGILYISWTAYFVPFQNNTPWCLGMRRKHFLKGEKMGSKMHKFQTVVTYHKGENEMGLQASIIPEIFNFLRIFLKTHREKEKGRNWEQRNSNTKECNLSLHFCTISKLRTIPLALWPQALGIRSYGECYQVC